VCEHFFVLAFLVFVLVFLFLQDHLISSQLFVFGLFFVFVFLLKFEQEFWSLERELLLTLGS